MAFLQVVRGTAGHDKILGTAQRMLALRGAWALPPSEGGGLEMLSRVYGP